MAFASVLRTYIIIEGLDTVLDARIFLKEVEITCILCNNKILLSFNFRPRLVERGVEMHLCI